MRDDHHTEVPVMSVTTCPVLDKDRIDEFMNDVVTDRVFLEDAARSATEQRRRFVAKSIIKAWGLIRHQIEHFEKFMDVYLPRIVHENSTILVDSETTQRRHVMEFGQTRVYKPTFKEANGETRPVFPWECRVRGLTYSCSVVCDIKYTVFDIAGLTAEQLEERGSDCSDMALCETRISRETLLCQIPCMLRSKFCWLHKSPFLSNECPMDQGGVFVVNGNDKDLITQEKLRTNYPCVFVEKHHSKHSCQCEVRSCHETKMRSTSTLYVYVSGGKSVGSDFGTSAEIVVNVPFIELDIPLVTMYRLLGVTSVEEMTSLIMEHSTRPERDAEMIKLVETALQNDLYQMSHKDLCEWVGKEGTSETTKDKRIKYVEHILANEFLPHIGLDRSVDTVRKKTYYFSYCIYKLCCVYLKRRKPDDRDHSGLKRLETSGTLMALLLRPLFRTMVKNAVSYIKRNTDSGKGINIAEAINHKRITSSFKYAMSTGNWGPQKGGSTSKGVAQVHNKMTITSGFSNLRKVNTPINKDGKVPRPRQLNPSHWGIYDPVETPEGQTCGLLKNLALGCHIRAGYDPDEVLDCLKRMSGFVPISMCSSEERARHCIVILNGAIAGYTSQPDDTVMKLRRMRQYQTVAFDTGIVYRPGLRSILVNTESGCTCRPIFSVPNLYKLEEVMRTSGSSPHTLVQQLMLEGVIVYVGKEEESTYRIAVSPKHLLDDEDNGEDCPYTHLEVHPVLLLGVCSSLIPFLNRNQAPRNTYQAAMGKQSQSVTGLNADYRVDTMAMSLCSPEVPLVQTMMEDVIGATTLPMGENAMMAIMSFTGYNQEDSVMLNQSALERGLFRSSVKRTYRDEEKARGTDSTKFERPPKRQCHGLRIANYDKINDQGFPEPGTLLTVGDVIIGKTMVTDEVQDPDAPKQQDANHRNRNIKRDGSTILMTNEPAVVNRVIDTKNKEGARAYRVSTIAFAQPELGDKFCLSMDHEVLTASGWKFYHQLNMNDRIATLEGGKLVYCTPIGLYEFEHDGEVYVVDSGKVSLRTTLNHKMWVKREGKLCHELLEAKSIVGERVSYQRSALWGGRQRFGVLPRLRRRSALGGEVFPGWVWTLDRRQCKVLMRRLLSGKRTVLTASRRFANDVQRLALHCGWSANVCVDKTGAFEVFVSATDGTPTVDPVHCEIANFTGKVFCVEVPSHVFYVRRNGIPVWTGNSSRHGQKGTVGMTYRQEDLPFNIRGEVPDVIVNPHAVPSRMTVGMLMEALLGKACLGDGQVGDGTPFSDDELTVDNIAAEVAKHGFQKYGKEVFYHPHTGEQIEAMIFYAPVYYQRLKHMANHKIHARATGPVQLVTQQPVEGRSHYGGFRVGEVSLPTRHSNLLDGEGRDDQLWGRSILEGQAL